MASFNFVFPMTNQFPNSSGRMGEAVGKVLVTFDIDGTLMRSSGASSNRLHKRAFSHAFSQIFGLTDTTIDVCKHHGSTDPLILVNTLEYYGIDRKEAVSKLPALKSAMVDYAKQHAGEVGDGLQLLPGVAVLLESLSSHKDALIGLVTGNLEDIAWMKMAALGIQSHFSIPNFGGFGSDHEDRGELVKLAAEKSKRIFGTEIQLHAHVGDTPNDIKAAEYGGAIPIGVCTGIFSKEDLFNASNTGNVVLFDNLMDTKAFFHTCGLQPQV